MTAPVATGSGKRFRAGCGTAGARGFTVIEMMVTVTILGILSAFALPSFNNFVKDQRVKTATSDVFASLILARSEAIKRNQYVAICASTNGTGCAGSTNWATGWIVFVDDDGDGAPASAADILKKQDAIPGVALTGTGTNVSYQRDGRLRATVAAFVLSSPGTSSITARCVRLDASGRPNVKVDTNKDPSDGCQ